VHALGQRAVVAILLAPFAICMIDWALRDSDDWDAGLAPAAFATGCVCLVVILRLSAEERGGRAGALTLVAVATWLALAVAWWAGGMSTPVYLWAAMSYLLLFPSLFAVVALIAVILARRSWAAVRGLAWLCAIVLVPGLVCVVELGG
jgi:hypothetical protein